MDILAMAPAKINGSFDRRVGSGWQRNAAVKRSRLSGAIRLDDLNWVRARDAPAHTGTNLDKVPTTRALAKATVRSIFTVRPAFIALSIG